MWRYKCKLLFRCIDYQFIKKVRNVEKMNVTCGTDIIEIERIKNLIEEEQNRALDRIFTEKEIKYSESKGIVKYQHYAARFAAKEAIFKAISNRLDNKFEISWKDVEILNDEKGRPEVHLLTDKLKDVKSIEISLSHCREVAVATAVAVWEEGK